MIRSALLLCAAIIVAACFACMPAPPQPSSPIGGHAPAPTCTAADFAKKINYVSTVFSPAPGSAQPVSSSSPPPNSPNYAQDLETVFVAASPEFAQQLCDLDRVYVMTASCSDGDCFSGSWGWLQSSNKVGNGRIVGISAGLWKQSYSQYETNLTQSLLPPNFTAVTYSNVVSCTSAGVCTPVDNLTETLMAALAHEIGHIGWYVLIDPLSTPTSFCNGQFFKPWAKANKPPPDSRGYPFRDFMTYDERQRLRSTGRWTNLHAQPPHIDQIDNPQPTDPPVYQSIYGLLAPAAPWASIFAAMSPDEDFVETYKFKVLTTAKAPLTSATITVSTGATTANVIADYLAGRKPVLTTKVGCMPTTLF